jgi:hypothetical protein
VRVCQNRSDREARIAPAIPMTVARKKAHPNCMTAIPDQVVRPKLLKRAQAGQYCIRPSERLFRRRFTSPFFTIWAGRFSRHSFRSCGDAGNVDRSVAHDEFGTPLETIRADGLGAAGFIFAAIADALLVTRKSSMLRSPLPAKSRSLDSCQQARPQAPG